MRSSNYANEEPLESTYSFSLFLSSTWIIKFSLYLLLHKRCSENRHLFSEPQKYGINCFSFSVERQPVLSMAACQPPPPTPVPCAGFAVHGLLTATVEWIWTWGGHRQVSAEWSFMSLSTAPQAQTSVFLWKTWD